MKNVSLIYSKKDRMRFVSHLDMTRFMSRMIQKSKIPVWYTEGFNKHIYITFALPLSLGFESDYEIMDFRLDDDNFSLEETKERLKNVFPEYVEIKDLFEPEMKTKEISFAQFSIAFDTNDVDFAEKINNFLGKREVLVLKKNKKGAISEIDIAPKIKDFSICQTDKTVLKITLSAGLSDNVNPQIIFSAMEKEFALPNFSVCRTAVYNESLKLFR